MRILFVTPQPPHETQGGAAIRNWHLIDAARRAGHHVDVLTFGMFLPHDGPPSPVPGSQSRSRSLPRRIKDLVASREPDLVHRLGATNLRRRVAELAQRNRYDFVQIEGLEMWPCVPNDIPAIYDAHNDEAKLQSRIARQALRDRDLLRAVYSTMQTRKLRRYEAAVIRRAIATIAVSQSDAEALRDLAPERPVLIVPIGVDTTYFVPDSASPNPETSFDLLFTGTMNYRANADAAEWFIRTVWPCIRAVLPTARLGIVGRGPSPSLRARDGRDGITVTGAVDDDRPYMAGSRVYVLPIRFGAGVRVKLLNAMSMGCAVVATPAACEGVSVVAGKHIVIADAEAAPFASVVLDLLADAEYRRNLGVAARAHMCEAYDWAHCTPELLALYARLEAARG